MPRNFTPEKFVQGKYFMATIYDEALAAKAKADTRAPKCWIGKEICPTTGRIHYQTFLGFAKNMRPNRLKKDYPGVHFGNMISSFK